MKLNQVERAEHRPMLSDNQVKILKKIGGVIKDIFTIMFVCFVDFWKILFKATMKMLKISMIVCGVMFFIFSIPFLLLLLACGVNLGGIIHKGITGK